jgi:hypothetical protein
MNLYKIKDWDALFENNKSRERERCSFCCIPNKQDGLGYGRLLRLPDGPALYGAFHAVVLMASKQKAPRRGYLTDTGLPTGCPLSAADMSVKTQFSAELIQKMLDAISSENIGWIEVVEQTPKGQASARVVPAECLGKKGKNEGEGSPQALSLGEKISLERELERVNKELNSFGAPKDYPAGSTKAKRLADLLARRGELRLKLGVVA